MTLQEWAEAYVRHKDLFERQIARIERSGRGFTIRRTDGTTRQCVVADVLDDGLVPLLEDHLLIVDRNRKENLDWVLRHWKALAALPGLRIVFANVAKNEKWVLAPHTHARVADPATLRQGLVSLFGSVPEE